MTITIYYTYGIINVNTKMMYIGSRQCKRNPIDDIGHKYFSSSTDKEFMREQKEHPENFRYRVLKLFENRHDAFEHEIYLHKKFDVARNPKFYNRARQTSTGFTSEGVSLTEERKRAISRFFKGRFVGEKNPNWGRKLSEEQKRHLSEINKGKKMSQESKQKIREANLGRVYSNETKEKMRQAKIGKYDGEKNPNWGKHFSNETKEQMRLRRLGKYNGENHPLWGVRGENCHVYGKMWIHNDVLFKETYVSKDTILKDGWKKGRLKRK